MDCPETYLDLLERYQTLFVGGLGFLGVIATLIVNVIIRRRQQAAELEHKRQAVRTALAEEFKFTFTLVGGSDRRYLIPNIVGGDAHNGSEGETSIPSYNGGPYGGNNPPGNVGGPTTSPPAGRCGDGA